MSGAGQPHHPHPPALVHCSDVGHRPQVPAARMRGWTASCCPRTRAPPSISFSVRSTRRLIGLWPQNRCAMQKVSACLGVRMRTCCRVPVPALICPRCGLCLVRACTRWHAAEGRECVVSCGHVGNGMPDLSVRAHASSLAGRPCYPLAPPTIAKRQGPRRSNAAPA